MKFFSVFGGIILLLVLGIDFNNGANATEGKNSICKELCEVCDEYFPTRLICYENLLQHICLDEFSSKVEALNTSDLCVWDKIKWPYDSFTKCTEEKADCLKIPWPNQLVEDMFVDIHATHFKSCPVKEFDDPPPDVLLALVMTPICLIPAMVMLVVVKTKNRNQNTMDFWKTSK
ncbi:receptor activity-modifying protein 2 isoform X2 [Paramormyrops kingsleyae]|uniref:receptor activity-modifying protein 2 isoform X2 n=1 Tax=Paramormyrops kingsleyae TaxID=1676925 RepID=UPI000CD5D5C3|nr:receptor activity-modifying protein 2-like isoform X2 [Paramormyrops kingsleyae]